MVAGSAALTVNGAEAAGDDPITTCTVMLVAVATRAGGMLGTWMVVESTRNADSALLEKLVLLAALLLSIQFTTKGEVKPLPVI